MSLNPLRQPNDDAGEYLPERAKEEEEVMMVVMSYLSI